MEELKNAFYEVMYKYKKSFSEQGVVENLHTWATNKTPLLELLRRHPSWDEEAKAVVIEFSEGRGIERDVIDEIAFTMLDLADEVVTDEQREAFHIAFNAAVSEYSSTLSEQTLETMRTNGNIKCATGQKTSRIIGKLCRTFHVDTHNRYNAVFAQLSDALNPLQIQKTAVLSLHPCDFLEMSSKSNTWTSCHNLGDGSYQAGALSYMTDDVSMIFFTVDPDVKDHFYRAPRRTRQMFFFNGDMLYQSRLYPSDLSEPMEQSRSIVQKIVSTCLGVPNLWTLKTKRDDLSEFCQSGKGSVQYPDYEHFGNLSVLKGSTDLRPIVIGQRPICVCCGSKNNFPRGSLKCRCVEQVVCQDCGQTVSRSNTNYIDDAFHCNACLHICPGCGRNINETMYPAFDKHGNAIEVCFDCYHAALTPCASCSVQNVCRILGNSLCPKTAITPAA